MLKWSLKSLIEKILKVKDIESLYYINRNDGNRLLLQI